MAGIQISRKGDFSKTFKFLNNNKKLKNKIRKILEKYGKIGVDSLRASTPKDTGKTSESWSYTIEETDSTLKIIWTNSNVNEYANIAVLIQYGHATRNGGWVEGIDYINPAMEPIFEEIAIKCFEEVTKV
jgi:hypothetical protein